MKQYGLKHIIIETSHIKKEELYENILLHEWLVELYDMSWKLRELYPQYKDINVEFSWDGREELLQVNNHFNYEDMQTRYMYLKKQWLNLNYDIGNSFLNSNMFDFNLQLIEKLTLWSLIERRLPFTDYELLGYTWYKNYSQESRAFLKKQWVRIVEGVYWHNTWIYFKYLREMKEILSYAKKFNSQI